MASAGAINVKEALEQSVQEDTVWSSPYGHKMEPKSHTTAEMQAQVLCLAEATTMHDSMSQH